MKKFSIVLATILMLTIFTGCAQNKGNNTALNPDEPISIAFWHYYSGDNQIALNNAIAEFNNTVGVEKGILVVPVGTVGMPDLESALYDSANGVINSQEMPDLFSAYPDTALNIHKMGLLANLNDYFTTKEKAAYVQSFLAEGEFPGDELLIIPVAKSTEIFYVNKTAWEEFASATKHVEKDLATWEGVYETARDYYNYTDALSPNIIGDGKAFSGIDALANYIVVGGKQLGVDIIDAGADGEGIVTLDLGVMKRLFDVYYKAYSLGYFTAASRFRSDDTKSGDIISYAGSTSGASNFPTRVAQGNTMLPIELLALTYPTFSGGELYAIQQGAGICVSKSIPAKEEGAAEFIKWFTGKQQNINFSITTGYLPTQVDAYNSEDFAAAVHELSLGTEHQKNISEVYDISLVQVQQRSTYSINPFPLSFNARSILYTSLQKLAEEGRETAKPLQLSGMPESEILEQLKPDDEFDNWISQISDELDFLKIAYTVS